LRRLAIHIRQDLRRQVQPGAERTAYRVRLPGGRTLTGTPGVLLHLADRIEQAATAAAGDRARVPYTSAMARAYTPPSAERGTQRLPDLSSNRGVSYDPADPTQGPGPELYQYWGGVWSPDATGPDGWIVATAEVECWDRCISWAAVRLAEREGVDLADDEILAVRWAAMTAPTCFFTAAQVRLAQWLVAHPGADLPPPPRRGIWFRLRRG